MNPREIVVLLVVLLSSISAQLSAEIFSEVAQHSLSQIEVAEGFRVELVAAEPLVQDPVDFDWGPDGKLWVVEMADYPLGDQGSGKPGGRVRCLEDADGDGFYERSTLFADKLSTPNGILFWKKGVLVTACPDVLYLEDMSGDGKADHIEKLFSGFTEGNEQHRVNGLRWGLDNWVYLANGDSGGTVVSHKTGKSININGRDLRIRPETGELETQSGRTQFGRNRDDWGNWFGCNNPNPIFHYVLDEQYLARNPHFAPPPVRRDIRSGDTLVYPIGPIISHCDTKYRKLGETPRFTSASATMVYRDNLFGPEYEQVTFTSEPVYNIVHARKLVPQGVTFESQKLHAGEQEFFRSEDPWSRPTGLHVGPDGALYIADMVREVIEHPEWIADDLEKTLNLYAGSEQGRIYRVLPVNTERREFKRLDTMTLPQLVAALESPSGWQRDLVQRMLIRSNDQSAVPLLRELMQNSPSPLARLHALCTLDGMQAITAEDVMHGCKDGNAGVRRHAIRLSEQFHQLAVNKLSQLDKCLISLANDTNPHVQLQLAYTLGEFEQAWASRLLAQIAMTHRDDQYLSAAVFSGLNKKNVDEVFRVASEQLDSSASLNIQLAAIGTKLGDPRALNSIVEFAIAEPSGWKLLANLFQALGSSGSSIDQQLDDAGLQQLKAIIASAQSSVNDETLPIQNRLAAISVLGYRQPDRDQDITLLSSLIAPSQPIEIQLAAMDALSATRVNHLPEILLQNWSRHSPRVRSVILDTLLSRTNWTQELLRQIENQTCSPSVLSSSQRSQLVQHRDKAVRELAERLLGRIETNRQHVLDRYQSVIQKVEDEEADLSNGQMLFAKKCAVCHKVGDAGHAVGPDLTAITNKSPTALLTAILDPNRAVEAKYLQYQVVTNEGKIFSGLLKDETSTSLTLIAAEGKSTTLLRTDIDVIQSSNQSMMPLDLEKDINHEEFADLLFYVSRLSQTK